MTLTQLEYLVAVDTHRHFAAAAEACFVTQPTLSMQIQKLEEELGLKIFDRTKQPVIPTELGARVIAQARTALREAKRIPELIRDQKDTTMGEIRIGIIPTLAPYLLPPLFKAMRQRYPHVTLIVKESLTEAVLEELKNNRLDCGLVATPLREASITEEILFYEELFVYVSKKNALYDKKFVLANDLRAEELWLLEEGHCFRSQVLNLCELRRASDIHFQYHTGNIEMLKRMVDKSEGITILPELAVMEMGAGPQKRIKQLTHPRPARQLSLITHRDHLKTQLISLLKKEILSIVPAHMHQLNHKKVMDINS
ncbi:MAG: LysR substrate-binding domain-containing protein [Cyclobacteriaceae bacterium]|jgi:LysR family hydrogen peroxide-inducible transcriptional activator|nr:LysR substrate-binding domain-containing protein [Cyclobacteriaceae bacterium]